MRIVLQVLINLLFGLGILFFLSQLVIIIVECFLL